MQWVRRTLPWDEFSRKCSEIKGGGYFAIIEIIELIMRRLLANHFKICSSLNISINRIMIKPETSNAYLKLLFVLCSDVDNVLS